MGDHAVALLEDALVADANRGGGGTLERSPGWARLTTTGALSEFRNAVLRAVLDPADADARIEETVAHFGARGTPFRWFITPSSRPLDLAERLERRGFRLVQVLDAMTARPDAFPAPADTDIDAACIGEEESEAWLDVCRRGWNMPAPALQRFRTEIRDAFAARPQRRFYFLARWRGTPAAQGSLTLLEGYAHLNGAVTLPDLRRRGLYRELILARMAFLKDRGVPLVTNHCRADTSGPICARLGFERACTFRAYRFPPPPA